ncbi:MAG: hypothetical protein R2804_10735 [Cyclobacteriaceae bacterium]
MASAAGATGAGAAAFLEADFFFLGALFFLGEDFLAAFFTAFLADFFTAFLAAFLVAFLAGFFAFAFFAAFLVAFFATFFADFLTAFLAFALDFVAAFFAFFAICFVLCFVLTWKNNSKFVANLVNGFKLRIISSLIFQIGKTGQLFTRARYPKNRHSKVMIFPFVKWNGDILNDVLS